MPTSVTQNFEAWVQPDRITARKLPAIIRDWAKSSFEKTKREYRHRPIRTALTHTAVLGPLIWASASIFSGGSLEAGLVKAIGSSADDVAIVLSKPLVKRLFNLAKKHLPLPAYAVAGMVNMPVPPKEIPALDMQTAKPVIRARSPQRRLGRIAVPKHLSTRHRLVVLNHA